MIIKKTIGVLIMCAIMTAGASAQSYINELRKYDPEFAIFFGAFAGDEVPNEAGVTLDDKTRYMAILAALLGRGAVDLYEKVLGDALDAGVTPVEAREILYQSVAYCGIGRIYPFFEETADVFKHRKIKLPLAAQGTTTPADRVEKGEAKQVEIFGDGMKGFSERGIINRWLSGNCFGDYYTRNGLDNRQREMITFCYIASDGTNEPQLRAHIGGNNLVGNDKAFLTSVTMQIMPYIGYPRTLNILTAINETLE